MGSLQLKFKAFISLANRSFVYFLLIYTMFRWVITKPRASVYTKVNLLNVMLKTAADLHLPPHKQTFHLLLMCIQCGRALTGFQQCNTRGSWGPCSQKQLRWERRKQQPGTQYITDHSHGSGFISCDSHIIFPSKVKSAS